MLATLLFEVFEDVQSNLERFLHGALLKIGKRMTKYSHTHKFTKCELKYASQTTISMHDENIPITNAVVFLLSL